MNAERVAAWYEDLANAVSLARGHDYADAKELARAEDALDEVFATLLLMGSLLIAADDQWKLWQSRAQKAEVENANLAEALAAVREWADNPHSARSELRGILGGAE